jgi:hypothetical protein
MEPSMSRTKKDRPYWVQTNDSQYTDHDHTHLGETRYKHVYDLDEHGNKIPETQYHYTRASTVVHYSWYSEKVIAAAKEAVANGDPDAWIATSSYEGFKSHREVDYVIPDYCTEGAKLQHGRWNGERPPCTPEIIKYDAQWTRGGGYSSTIRKSYRDLDNGHNRRMTRDGLRTIVNEYNSGEEPDNFEQTFKADKWWW